MNVRRSLVCALVVCLVVNVVPAGVWAAERETEATAVGESAPAPVVDFRASVRVAVETLETPAVASSRPGTPSATRTAAVRRQGGGGVGMVIGLVSMVAGVAMTYYMIKQMKQEKDDE